MEPETSARVVILTAASGFVLSLLLYSFFSQPLRKFPGPFITTLSRAPYWIAVFTGNELKFIQNLHTKYGPVVRYGPGELSYTDPRAWKDIYGYEKGRTENPKDIRIYGESWNGVNNIVTADATTHARFRKVLAPAFSDKALYSQEEVFKKYANLMVTKLRQAALSGSTEGQQQPPPLDMVSLLNFTTFDIMAELTFGEPLGLLENSEYTPWVQRIFDSVWVRSLLSFVAYYPLVHTVFKLVQPKALTDIGNAHFQHSVERVNKRLRRGSTQPDIWNLVLSAKDNSRMTLDEMHTNADFMMAAGSETTATLLSGLLYFLLSDPHRMAKLTTEVRKGFARDEDIGWSSLQRLPYTKACIDEALRLFPPIPSIMPRITPERGNVILGQWVPAGTAVSVNHTASSRSPDNFKNPDKFIPERWMGASEYQDDNREASQPFSLGPRQCLARNMALYESRLLLVKIINIFDLELCDGQSDWPDQKVWLIRQKKPLLCRVVPRDSLMLPPQR